MLNSALIVIRFLLRHLRILWSQKIWHIYKSSLLETLYLNVCLFVCLILFNTTLKNILVISWRSVLLLEKTTDQLQVTDKLYHIMLYTSPWSRFELKISVVIDTDCIGSCKSNYHTITVTTAPYLNEKNH